MNPAELVSDLRRCGPQPLEVIFTFIASRTTEARLNDGQRLNDVTDFAMFLLECSEAAKVSPDAVSMKGSAPIEIRTGLRVGPRPAESRFDADRTCPRCGHVHEGSAECGATMGANRVCRCEMEVLA